MNDISLPVLGAGTLETLADRTLSWAVKALPPSILVVVLTLLVFVVFRFVVGRFKALLMRRVKGGQAREEMEKRADTLVSVLRKVGYVTILAIACMIVLGHLGVEIGPILAGAGIVGVAVGFGSQNLVRDVLSGFFILLEDQVRVGDVAVINGTGGLVEEINLRTIVLRDLEGTVHVFPHGLVSTLSNRTKEWSAAVFDTGVAYREDTDRVQEVMREVAEDLARDERFGALILEPIEIFGVDRFDESAVVIKARIKTRPIKQWDVAREYNRRLKKAFDEKGIEIPFPQRTLTWGEAGDAAKPGAAGGPR
jgi:small conductance mechanosensitive channel